MWSALRQLKVNQRGRIELPNADGTTSGAEGVVRAVSESSIRIEFGSNEHVPDLARGAKVTFKFWDLFGLHRGETRIASVSTKNPNELEIAMPLDFELTQKRKFFRMDAQVPVTLWRGPTLENVTHATTEDVTPGGMRFVSTERMSIGDRLRVRLDFATRGGDERVSIFAEANVVRSVARSEDVATLFAVSVAFVALTESDQAKIALLLFEAQRRVPS